MTWVGRDLKTILFGHIRFTSMGFDLQKNQEIAVWSGVLVSLPFSDTPDALERFFKRRNSLDMA